MGSAPLTFNNSIAAATAAVAATVPVMTNSSTTTTTTASTITTAAVADAYSTSITDNANGSYLYAMTNPPEEEDSEDIQKARALFAVVVGINRYYLWILFALGFPGNCAAVVTICRMRRSSIGTSLFPLFVVMLAVADSVALVVKLVYFQLIDHQVSLGDTGCCLLRFLGSWTTAYSCWVLVLMALERFVAVRFPRAIMATTVVPGCGGGGGVCERCQKTSVKAAGALFLVGLVLALIYMPLLWTTQVDAAGFHCQYKSDYAAFMTEVYIWVTGATFSFVPFCLLTTFNVLFALHVRRGNSTVRTAVRCELRNEQELLSSSAESGLNSTAETLRTRRKCHSTQIQVNVMLLSATVVFVVLTFPICLYLLADTHWTPTSSSSSQSHYTSSVAVKFLCQQIAYVLVDSTHAVNFYLYFLSARRFRRHFLRLLACSAELDKKKKKRGGRGCKRNCCCCCFGVTEFLPPLSRNKQHSSVSWSDGGDSVEMEDLSTAVPQPSTVKSPTGGKTTTELVSDE